MSDVGKYGHTADQILGGISAALKAEDMPAAAGLIRYLATVDPAAAALIVETARRQATA